MCFFFLWKLKEVVEEATKQQWAYDFWLAFSLLKGDSELLKPEPGIAVRFWQHFAQNPGIILPLPCSLNPSLHTHEL